MPLHHSPVSKMTVSFDLFEVHKIFDCKFLSITSSPSSSLRPSFKCTLRESGCRADEKPTIMSRGHFWQLITRDNNVEVSALSIINN